MTEDQVICALQNILLMVFYTDIQIKRRKYSPLKGAC